MIAFLNYNPDFLKVLEGKRPDFLVPEFVFRYFPAGAVGLFMAGIFAATMSSIDSAMNALSAATYEDFLARLFPSINRMPQGRQILLSKLLTLLWGTFSTLFALTLIRSPETVIELVNRIGSAFYGPILAVFLMGMFSRRISGVGAIAGLISGVAFNLYLWKFAPGVSWMWWNLFGFMVAVSVGGVVSLFVPERREVSPFVMGWDDLRKEMGRRKGYIIGLLGMFLFIVAVSMAVEGVFKVKI
jgi:SSS family solute:Na+ symporter